MGQQIPEHNLNSVLPYSKSIITATSTTWHGSPFYLLAVVSSHHFSFEGHKYSQGHVNRHLAYPPQTDVDRLISIYPHLSACTAHLIRRAHRGVTTYWWWGPRGKCLGRWDVPAITQPQRATAECFRHAQPDQGTDASAHWGSKQTKKRPFPFSDANTARLPSLGEHKTTSRISTATHSWTAMTAHRHAFSALPVADG